MRAWNRRKIPKHCTKPRYRLKLKGCYIILDFYNINTKNKFKLNKYINNKIIFSKKVLMFDIFLSKPYARITRINGGKYGKIK